MLRLTGAKNPGAKRRVDSVLELLAQQKAEIQRLAAEAAEINAAASKSMRKPGTRRAGKKRQVR
jgi:hypothetical protein